MRCEQKRARRRGFYCVEQRTWHFNKKINLPKNCTYYTGDFIDILRSYVILKRFKKTKKNSHSITMDQVLWCWGWVYIQYFQNASRYPNTWARKQTDLRALRVWFRLEAIKSESSVCSEEDGGQASLKCLIASLYTLYYSSTASTRITISIRQSRAEVQVFFHPRWLYFLSPGTQDNPPPCKPAQFINAWGRS